MYGLVPFEITLVCKFLSTVIAKQDWPGELSMYDNNMFLEIVFMKEFLATLFAGILHFFMYTLYMFLEIGALC